jgi:Protein of unknown function (DUF2851)
MQEDLLQYIWQFQYFNTSELVASNGDIIHIIHPGVHNHNQGPDFTGARIQINDTLWAGNVELHIHASDWNLHNHSADANYDNIILHVVWNQDVVIPDRHGHELPALELGTRVSKVLLEKYRELMLTSRFIPCEGQVHRVNNLVISGWKQRMAAERLLAKSSRILLLLQDTTFHWEEVFWQMTATNFGLRVNSDLFQRIACTLSVSILAKHKNNLLQVEALLFGQAGLLKGLFHEKYPQMLQKEYVFYKKKYGLPDVIGELFFLRMRPANFPTIRLAQLSMLIHQSEHLFSRIKESSSLQEVRHLLHVEANDYWHYHYVFDEESGYKVKALGSQMINNIIINTVVPVLFAYGVHNDEQACKEKALQWLEELSPEKNKITKGFESIGFTNRNAQDSQGLLQLKNEYCDKKLCLSCAIGNGILNRDL